MEQARALTFSYNNAGRVPFWSCCATGRKAWASGPTAPFRQRPNRSAASMFHSFASAPTGSLFLVPLSPYSAPLLFWYSRRQ